MPASLPLVTPPLVSVRELAVARGSRLVLSGVDADITRGGITALVGLNGSGKSTFLRTLLGELPYQGRITYRCGHDHLHPRPEYVGYVPQRLTIDARLPMTVRDFLGLAMNGRRPIFLGHRKSLARRLTEILDNVGCRHLLDVPVDGLSGGQLQRVLLALALEPHPELLLLDEPAAGIDFRDISDFYKLIADLNRKSGVTVLLVSHDLQAITGFATRVLCLRDGRIFADGTPEQVLTPERISAVFGQR